MRHFRQILGATTLGMAELSLARGFSTMELCPRPPSPYPNRHGLWGLPSLPESHSVSDSQAAQDAPKNASARFGYIAPLDGVRAVAILGVMAYHGGLPWAPGGFFGVDAFFVLSGFLITSLLVSEWRSGGTILLRAFWARRARRLLPALFLLIVGVMLYARFFAMPGTFPHLRSDAIATLLYVANWHFILLGNNYFNQFGNQSPFIHTWSLAIEEQFYIVWPLVMLAILRWRRSLRPVLVLCIVGAIASAIEMAVLFHAGADPTRVYYGTDTRAQSLLIGAALAVWFAMKPAASAVRQLVHLPAPVTPQRARPAHLRPGVSSSFTRYSHRFKTAAGGNSLGRKGQAAKWSLSIAGLAGVAMTAWLWSHLSGGSILTYEGGFAMAALSMAAVIATAVRHPTGLLARVLSLAPLKFIGRISYGLYLWHWPVFMIADSAKTGLTGYELFALRVAITFAFAITSFYLIEQPIRRGTWLRGWTAWLATPAAVVGTAAIVVVTTVASPAGALESMPTGSSISNGAKAGTPYGSVGYHQGSDQKRQFVAPNPPVRVLLVGDSTAFTLGFGMDLVAKRYGVNLDDRGILGCGLVEGGSVKVHGKIYTSSDVASPCSLKPGVPQWPALWATEIAHFKPRVVMVLAGRWEVMNRTYHGKWVHIGEPVFDAYIKHQMELAVQVIKKGGATADLLTAPCYYSGEQLNGSPWPEDNPARVAEYNKLLREVAAQHRHSVVLTHFHSMVCPHGKFAMVIDHVTVRTPDGVHFTNQGGEWLASKLLPQVVGIALSHSAKTIALSHSAKTAGSGSRGTP